MGLAFMLRVVPSVETLGYFRKSLPGHNLAWASRNSSQWNRVSTLECSSGKKRIKRPRPSAISCRNSPQLKA